MTLPALPEGLEQPRRWETYTMELGIASFAETIPEDASGEPVDHWMFGGDRW